MHQSQAFVTGLLSLLFVCLQTTSGNSVSKCFDSPNPNKMLEMKCGQGYMVHVVKAFYGYSATGQCRLVGGNDASCIKYTTDSTVKYDCVGQSSCAIEMPTGPPNMNIPNCGEKSNYFQVNYECVEAESVHDICKEDRLDGQSGYIQTPSYPLNYKQQGRCALTVTVDPSQRIRLTIIDMELKNGGHTRCTDTIYFNDRLRSVTLCNHRTNYTSEWLSNHLYIELNSTSGGLSKGFWLYYEAFPPLPTTIPKPELPTTDIDSDSNEEESNNNIAHASSQMDTNDNEDTKGENAGNNGNEDVTPVYENPDSTVPLIRSRHPSSRKLPFAAIAGGVIGTLSLILVILLLMLLVKWLKERHYYRAEKILEIRNPAFRSSGDFYEQQQHQHQQPNNSDYNYC